MKISPIYTLKINDDVFINCESEIKVNLNEDCNDRMITGLFKQCDAAGIWIEIGADKSKMVYVFFNEIENIEVI